MSQKQKIINALRKLWNESELKHNFKKSKQFKVLVGQFKNGKDKYIFHETCVKCGKNYPTKEKLTQVDHIDPVVQPDVGFQNWDVYIQRLLFCGEENLQILCKRCHAIKTKRERPK